MKIDNIIITESDRGREYLVYKDPDNLDRYIYGYKTKQGTAVRIPNDHPFYKIKRATREKLIDKDNRANIFNVNLKNANDGTVEYDLPTNSFIWKDTPQGAENLEGQILQGLPARAIWNSLGVGIGGTTKSQDALIQKGKTKTFGKDGKFGKYGSFTRFIQGKDDDQLARDVRQDPTASTGEKLFTYYGLKALGYGADGSKRRNLMKKIPLDPDLKDEMDTHIKFGHSEYLVKILTDVQNILKNAKNKVKRSIQGPNKQSGLSQDEEYNKRKDALAKKLAQAKKDMQGESLIYEAPGDNLDRKNRSGNLSGMSPGSRATQFKTKAEYDRLRKERQAQSRADALQRRKNRGLNTGTDTNTQDVEVRPSRNDPDNTVTVNRFGGNAQESIPIGSILNDKGDKFEWNGSFWINKTKGNQVEPRAQQPRLTQLFKNKLARAQKQMPNDDKFSNVKADGSNDGPNAKGTSVDRKFDKKAGSPPPMPGEEPEKNPNDLDPETMKVALADMKAYLRKIEIPRPDPNSPEYKEIALQVSAGQRSPYKKLDQQLIKLMRDIINKGQLFPAFEYAAEQNAQRKTTDKLFRDKEMKFYNPKFDQSEPGDRKLRDPITSKINNIQKQRQAYLQRNVKKIDGGVMFKNTQVAKTYVDKLDNYDKQIQALRLVKSKQSDDQSMKFQYQTRVKLDYAEQKKQQDKLNRELQKNGQPQLPVPTFQQYQDEIEKQAQLLISQGMLLPQKNQAGTFAGMGKGSKDTQYRKKGTYNVDLGQKERSQRNQGS